MGTLAVWPMVDSIIQLTQYLSPRELADPNWHVAGVADMNADGKPDLVWQNIATGELGVWYLNGVTLIGGAI